MMLFFSRFSLKVLMVCGFRAFSPDFFTQFHHFYSHFSNKLESLAKTYTMMKLNILC